MGKIVAQVLFFCQKYCGQPLAFLSFLHFANTYCSVYTRMEHRLKYKKIGIIYVGGADKKFRSASEFGVWLKGIFEWRMMARLQPFIANGQWWRAARTIASEWKKYDGFVVMLAQKDVVFISSAIATTLGLVGKPVVYIFPSFAGKTPSMQEQLEFRTRIINAIQTSTQDIAGHITVEAYDALPLADVFHKRGDKIYGHFDFGYRLSQYAVHRNVLAPSSPRLKAIARVVQVDKQELVPPRDVHGCIVMGPVSPQRLHIPALSITRAGVNIVYKGKVTRVPLMPDIARGQFLFAIQKGFEAGDMSDVVHDMLSQRIDVIE